MKQTLPAPPTPMPVDEPTHPGVLETVEDQLALRALIREYLIPVETNIIWYALGGVLMISLILEFLSGGLLLFTYTPDAGQAYQITRSLINSPLWHIVINFHYFNAYVIFGLVMIHMMRVFVSGGYRRGKQGTWLIGAVLAGLAFLASLTGETLHWDEVGFAVPWHISEFFQALGLENLFGYTFAALKNIPTATEKLSQIYGVHVSIAVILLVVFIAWHLYLVKVKGISLPFWVKSSGRTAPFSTHIRAWLVYSSVILGAVLLLAIFWPRNPGIPPQLLPESPFYGSTHGPGFLGAKPTFPISWTHGMNVFIGEYLGIEPDIWGTVVGMILMTVALLAIPFVDRAPQEPANRREAFDWRQRKWAFLAIGLFWLVMILGVVVNATAGAG